MWNNISNFAAIIANRMVRTKLNPLDLLPLGARDESYDGNYKDAAILPKDLVAAADAQNTGYYTLDIDAFPFAVTVNTVKGIIEIINTDAGGGPAENFGNPYVFFINNPDLDLTVANRDNIYMQYSAYYSPGIDDNAIPYLMATGFVPTGAGFSLYNANPAVADTGNWTGALYVYYELYTK